MNNVDGQPDTPADPSLGDGHAWESSPGNESEYRGDRGSVGGNNDGTEKIGVVVMAYGTPNASEEIEAYYTDIRRGKPPTAEQLADLTDRYEAIGGLSPLTARTQAQRDAIQRALDDIDDGRYQVVLGLKHAAPTIEQAVASLADHGITQAIGVVFAPHFSEFSVGQYLQRLDAAAANHGLSIAAVRTWATEPAFVQFVAEDLERRIQAMGRPTRVLFTAHSLPERILDADDPYPDEVHATAEAVGSALGLQHGADWQLAWQSAGRTPEPWLGPDVTDAIESIAAEPDGPDAVIVSAVGFVADHLEVLYDLDIEARDVAEDAGLSFDRTTCVNDDDDVMRALATRIDALAVEQWGAI